MIILKKKENLERGKETEKMPERGTDREMETEGKQQTEREASDI